MLVFGALTAAVLTMGCGREEPVQTYREVTTRLPVQAPPPSAESAPDRGAAQAVPSPASANGMKLAWTLPEGWTETPGSGMRAASFKLPGEIGDGSLTTLGGQAGGARANVRRWAGQISLTLSEDELGAFLASSEDLQTRGGLVGTFYDFVQLRESWDEDAMFATILVSGGQTVFVKLVAPAEALTANRNASIAFSRSLRFEQ